jgi:hypothetical protein
MMAASMTPATALNLPSTALGQSVAASAPIEKVWCRWGCGPGPLVGGFVAGAVVGAVVASAARPAYAPVYEPVYAGPCWRRWIGPYGGVHWQRVC